jgi:hypothetical protein
VSERRQSHNKRRRNPRLETLPKNRTTDQRVTSQAFAVSINKVFGPQSPKAEGFRFARYSVCLYDRNVTGITDRFPSPR